MRRTLRLSAALLTLLCLPGCVGGDRVDEGGRVSMDMQGAANRADEILDQVMGEIKPAVNGLMGLPVPGVATCRE